MADPHPSDQKESTLFKLTDPLVIADRHQQYLHRPERIGPYRILDEIGEGAMGVVYLAERDKPLHQRVALKVIKLGMDTRQVVARFETEREALAVMNHPNVAKVFDAGVSDDGRPYFAMEHVPGMPITEYCDKQRLTTRERLLLFMDVAYAVQHAHQKGIIHRDIKPSNVLVAVQEDRPIVKVIDFGVAKATQQHLTERTVFTEQGQLIGTPGYMSPEQAEMTALDIDTRTDIYSLGVLLYELLVGARPFDDRLLRQVGLAEIQRIIREVDPPKPSTRLSGLGSDPMGPAAEPPLPGSRPTSLIDQIAQHRHTEPRMLVRQIRGDLDWIVMKCLEKDRTRRYATAIGLALEVQRYLLHQPVLAGPPNPLYRLRKFVRRNRAAVLASSLIALVLVVGAAAVSWQEVRARRAALALARANAYRIVLEAQETADLSSTTNTANTAKVIDDCTRAIDLEPNLAAAYALRGKMLSRTGSDDAAKRDCDRALELEPSNSLALRTLGYLRLERGDYQSALDAYEQGIRGLFISEGWGLPEDFHNRARLYRLAGNYPEAMKDHDRAIAFAPQVGLVYQGRGLTRRFAGDIDGAIEDCVKAGKLKGRWFLQCSQWNWEMRNLRGAPGDREAAEAILAEAKLAAKDTLENTMIAISLGEVSAEEGVAAARSNEKLRCAAFYYAGARALVQGSRDQAEALFRQCQETRMHMLPEHELAVWHLKQLGR